MLKKIIVLSAVIVVPAAGALAGDFRTLYPAGTLAQQMHANGGAVARRAEAPYALTGERPDQSRTDRQESARRFNWQAGSAHFRPGK